MSKSLVLGIIEEELTRLHKEAKESTETSILIMTAHSIGLMQRVKQRIEEEV